MALPFPLVYSEGYDLHLGDHVFPAKKYKWLHDRLVRTRFAAPENFVEPEPASDEDILLAHEAQWVDKLRHGTLTYNDILTLEIQKTFDFFRATASGENIQRIMVAGGTARVPGLVDLLREEFAMPVEELNPFRKVLINPGKHSEDQIRELAPKLVVAVGLALRSFD